MPVTVTIADDLAKQLEPYEAQFPEIVALGLRELRARSEGGYRGVLERLAGLPTPEEVLALRPAPMSGAIVPLFHPRRDRWADHFRLVEG